LVKRELLVAAGVATIVAGWENVRLDFKGRVDIRTIGQLIGQHVL